jgi:6-pyruvoyltetrahydropterin/6-carboxytetrahydropterin synthase
LSEPVFEITVEASFPASHQLRDGQGGVEPLHGHNFRVEASVASPDLDEIGLVVDFLELEAILVQVLSPYNHRHLNDLVPFDELNPSTENMARFFYEKLQEKLAPRRLEVRCVRVWEAPKFSASYGKR